MGSGGSAPKPDVIHPGEAAQAAVGTAAAGEMMSVANQPVEQYANLATTSTLGPAEVQAQQGLANQAALQSAQAQMNIQSQVDPLAYAQRQMRLKAATDRLGQLYGTSAGAFSYNAPGAYAMPRGSDLAGLNALAQQQRNIASNLSTASVDRSGANPQLNKPQNAFPVTSYI